MNSLKEKIELIDAFFDITKRYKVKIDLTVDFGGENPQRQSN